MHKQLKQIKFDDYIKAKGWKRIPFSFRWLNCLNPMTTSRKSFTLEHEIKGLTLKLNRHQKTLRIRRHINGKDVTPIEVCSWQHDEQAPINEIESLLKKFINLEASLPYLPTTADLLRENIELRSVGDALLIYQQKLEAEYGESGDAPKKIERLLRLHLKQAMQVLFNENRTVAERTLVFADVPIRELTAYQFNLYLTAYEDKRGVRDEIIKFVKAAANHCKAKGLLKAGELYDWSKVYKSKVERHVSFLDLDMSTLLRAVSNINHEDFKLYIYLAVHGHFRKSLTAALEFDWFNHQHGTLIIPAHMYKNRQAMEFKLSPTMMKVVHHRREELPSHAKFLFPSETSLSRHRTNFDYQWYKLMGALGLYEDIVNEVGETTRVYKYRQHDFRDTLIDRLLDLGVDEQVMASALGHASLFSVTAYKQAKARHKENASDINNRKLVDKFTGMEKLQKELFFSAVSRQDLHKESRDLHQERKDLSLLPRNQTGTKSHRVSAKS